MSAPQHTCCYKIPRASGWRTVYEPCTRKGKVEREGKWYCGQHDPVARKERNDKARAEHDARWEAQRKKWTLEQAAPDLYAALTQAIGPLEYAYRNVSSVTADKVKQQILPAMRAALARARGETP